METLDSNSKYLLRGGQKIFLCFQDGSKVQVEADGKFATFRHEDGTEFYKIAISDFGRAEMEQGVTQIDPAVANREVKKPDGGLGKPTIPPV